MDQPELIRLDNDEAVEDFLGGFGRFHDAVLRRVMLIMREPDERRAVVELLAQRPPNSDGPWFHVELRFDGLSGYRFEETDRVSHRVLSDGVDVRLSNGAVHVDLGYQYVTGASCEAHYTRIPEPDELPHGAVQAIRSTVAALVAGRAPADVKRVIDEYPATLVYPEDDPYAALEPIAGERDGVRVFHLDCPLWTKEEGRSDLEVRLTLVEVGTGCSTSRSTTSWSRDRRADAREPRDQPVRHGRRTAGAGRGDP
ncbi:hypothetical protein EV193_105281 [Herbihabitans rhizosphaerae]|uniref:DUF7668 domain-containing protein n=1 Tax=Herbihabitans rhizosphaerae TaxID=1872711 RepID=A0A4V2ESI8_9PSEU|nr:hypothetical protein [Herbihabitans rhizosphaerae]RZS37723.1 hypothetical protein EV193_105281 [Herbihabitans rhizosphaerae]